jgi:hypothetical protein
VEQAQNTESEIAARTARPQTAEDIANIRAQSAQDIAGTKAASAETIAGDKGKNQSDLISQRSQAASDLEKQKQSGRKEIANMRASVQRELKADKGPAGSKVTPRIQAMADMAKSTLPHIDSLMAETKSVADLLGPAAGRYSEFMTGKVGAPNQRFAHYMDEVSFLDSAITLAHSQGRVSNLIYENFKRMFDSGKQSPENMMEALKVAKEWMTGYAQMGGGEATPSPVAGGGGVRVQQNSKGDYRYSTDGGKTWQMGKPPQQ